MAKNNQVGNKKPNVFRRFGNFLGKSASELKKGHVAVLCDRRKKYGYRFGCRYILYVDYRRRRFRSFRSAQSAYGRVVKIGGK